MSIEFCSGGVNFYWPQTDEIAEKAKQLYNSCVFLSAFISTLFPINYNIVMSSVYCCVYLLPRKVHVFPMGEPRRLQRTFDAEYG